MRTNTVVCSARSVISPGFRYARRPYVDHADGRYSSRPRVVSCAKHDKVRIWDTDWSGLGDYVTAADGFWQQPKTLARISRVSCSSIWWLVVDVTVGRAAVDELVKLLDWIIQQISDFLRHTMALHLDIKFIQCTVETMDARYTWG